MLKPSIDIFSAVIYWSYYIWAATWNVTETLFAYDVIFMFAVSN